MRFAGVSILEFFRSCSVGITPIYVSKDTTDAPNIYSQGFILKRSETEGQIFLTAAYGETNYTGWVNGKQLTWKAAVTANETSWKIIYLTPDNDIKNCNDLPIWSVGYSYSITENKPPASTAQILTFGAHNSLKVQLSIGVDNSFSHRTCIHGSWSTWSQ